MRIIIIGNGTINDRNIIKDNIMDNDIVVCCDGGLNYAFEEGIIPKCIIGDFDSVSEQVLKFFENKNIPIKKFPTKKDYTDMELCLEFCIKLSKETQAEEIIILGGIGSRFDHSLANAHILKMAADEGITASLLNENNRVYLIKDNIKIRGLKGSLVSLIPFGEKAKGVKTNGLFYELDSEDMLFGRSLGISNVITAQEAEISLTQGYLFVILAKD